ncbi:hypothetical protein BI004_gp120 [Bacillus phage NotTheCreek]|uniref:hypothetical protein n=1 Tax=Bacillus phage NotTheCreek TaxID=1805952 RepID=UPI0007A77806|nr:hypothetical protein BI004_gp120 [Bacillus phage NotTheCreek]AMW63340.1 hypothetical protein NOTTHECREEK_120 [Bacillus phage NotTheCreek]
MKKKLAALALSSTLLVGLMAGCASNNQENKKAKSNKTPAELRGVTIWAKQGSSEVVYEAKDIKDYYRANKSGVLVITFKDGSEVTVTEYHMKEEHPNAD